MCCARKLKSTLQKRVRLSSCLSLKSVCLFFVFFISQVCVPVESTFNFYMNTDEVKRILGTSKELYYVREGVVNSYALNFIVTIPAVITSLHFTWESLGQKPLPYSIAVESSDLTALQTPLLSIPSSGVIPTVPTTFLIHLPCSGQRSTEVLVSLALNVTADPKFKPLEIVPVLLKRKKICLEGHPDKITPLVPSKKSPSKGISQTSGGNNSSKKSPSSSKKSLVAPQEDFIPLGDGEGEDPSIVLQDAPPTTILFIILASSLGFILILLAILTAAYIRTKKNSVHSSSRGFLQHMDTSGKNSSGGTSSASSGGGPLFAIPSTTATDSSSDSPHHHYSTVSPCLDSGSYTYSTFFHLPPTAPTVLSTPVPSLTPHYSEIPTLSSISSISSSSRKLKDILEVPRCSVRLQSVLMEGSFAKLYRGTVSAANGGETKVLIKTVSEHSSPVQMALLLHEGLSLVGLSHQHVNAAIGVAAEERVPPFLIYVDDSSHNLKRFLQSCRSGPGRPITPQEIVWMAIQLAAGVSFLHKQNVLHRDIATRNITVTDKFGVKLSDAALSRDIFPEDYSWMGEAETRPVRWSPPESLLQPRYSTASDTWSFGVTLWELATLAQTPFAEVDPADLFSFLKMGYRLSQPVNCPDELFSIMSSCWTWESDDRPKWTCIIPELQALHIQLDQYV